MPEMIEVEMYRRLAEQTRGRMVTRVEVCDPWFCKGASGPEAFVSALTGFVVVEARRTGKLLVLAADSGVTLGIRFGMTGRLIVDGVCTIDRLLYSSDRNLEEWDRFRLHFADGGSVAVRDPRRLGGVELDPDLSRLGPDAGSVTTRELQAALTSTAALKSVLLDQKRLAGIGNLLADEILWRTGLSPARPAESVDALEVKRLRSGIHRTLAVLTRRGGSHTGDFMEHRVPGGHCPRDGSEVLHAVIGGRSTWWCGHHQV